MLGTISHGTLRPDDLIPAFVNELRDFVIRNPEHENIGEFNKLVEEGWNWHNARRDERDGEDTDFLLDELFDALDSLAPPYCYFGANESDGSDFGFWPAIDALEEACRDGEVLKVDDLSEVPSDWRDGVMLVNDHGNVTYLEWSDDAGEHVTVWDCV